ncbi:hypothetical protein C3R44_21815, partial [Mycobacterium tuberculosis]
PGARLSLAVGRPPASAPAACARLVPLVPSARAGAWVLDALLVAAAPRLAAACGFALVALGPVVRPRASFPGGAGALLFRPPPAPLEPAAPLRPLLAPPRG